MNATKPRTPPATKLPDSNAQTPTNTDGVEVEDFGLDFDPPSPSPGAASPKPSAPPIASVAESTPTSVVWHLSLNGGRQEGPLLTEEIRRRLADGSLPSDCLIWRPGMARWERITSVLEFQPQPTSTEANPWQDPINWTAWANTLLVASLVLWGVSSIGGYWGFSWFTGGLLLFLGYLICHGFAQVIERLSRIEARLSSSSGGDNQHG